LPVAAAVRDVSEDLEDLEDLEKGAASRLCEVSSAAAEAALSSNASNILTAWASSCPCRVQSAVCNYEPRGSHGGKEPAWRQRHGGVGVRAGTRGER